MSDIEPKKLKVAELREELKARGLDTKGNKAQLVKRLEKALKTEDGLDGDQDTSQDFDSSVNLDDSQDVTQDDEPEGQAMTEARAPDPVHIEDDPEPEPVEAEEPEDAQQPAEEEQEQESYPESQQEEAHHEPMAAEEDQDQEPESTQSSQAQQEEDEEAEVKEEVKKEVKEEASHEQEMKEEEQQEEAEVYEVKDEIKDEESEAPEADQKEKVKKERDDHRGEKRKREDGGRHEHHHRSRRSRSRSPRRKRSPGSASRDEQRHHRSHGSKSRSKSPRHKRSRSPSPSHDRHQDRQRHRYDDKPLNIEMENDDWVTLSTVVLDKYNSDLNLRIHDSGTKANPITVEGFAFMWAGARATYGVTKGKVAFEIKLGEHLAVDHLPPDETTRHVVRVGFSTDSTSLQLGEEKLSYGYGGTGKASTECNFKDYGETFGENDVVGSFVDFESDPVIISYTKNGVDLGTCFEIPASELEGKALFPHILSKNTEFEVNFGTKEEPFFPPKEGFTWIASVPEEERVRGSLPPTKKEECEMIMMCGLPGCGKTTWAAKHALENPEKKFNVLGTNNIIDKMKVMGLPRKKNYSGRWDMLIDKATKCLNRMLEIAAKKKRNYILDQTNVYPSAQRRKMRPFEGFQRKAIVIVPTDEEFKKRCEQREKEEGKEVPDSAVLEMKANFQLPEEGPLFDKVEYIELDKEEAAKLIDEYRKDAEAKLPPPEKRWRDNRNNFGYGRERGRDNRGYHGRDRFGSGYNRQGDRHGRGNRRGGGYMGYSNNDRNRHDNRNKNWNQGSGNWNKNWGNQGNWGNQSGWGNQGWGNQGWGNQGWGNQGWGNQGWNYNQGTGQNWDNQNYNYNWGNGQNWGNYNQGTGQNYWDNQSSYNYTQPKQ